MTIQFDSTRGGRRFVKTLTLTGLSAGSVAIVGGLIVAEFGPSFSTSNAQPVSCHPPKYTESGDLVLPDTFREWVFVGSSLTPNALNGGMPFFRSITTFTWNRVLTSHLSKRTCFLKR